MAICNIDNYSEKDGLGFPLNFRRGEPNPLDNSSVHATYNDAVTYASTDVAYVGQILTVIYSDEEKTTIKPTVYVIQADGSLKNISDIDGLDGKVDKEDGKGLSTNDYTDEDKNIVDTIADTYATKDEVADTYATKDDLNNIDVSTESHKTWTANMLGPLNSTAGNLVNKFSYIATMDIKPGVGLLTITTKFNSVYSFMVFCSTIKENETEVYNYNIYQVYSTNNAYSYVIEALRLANNSDNTKIYIGVKTTDDDTQYKVHQLICSYTPLSGEVGFTPIEQLTIEHSGSLDELNYDDDILVDHLVSDDDGNEYGLFLNSNVFAVRTGTMKLLYNPASNSIGNGSSNYFNGIAWKAECDSNGVSIRNKYYRNDNAPARYTDDAEHGGVIINSDTNTAEYYFSTAAGYNNKTSCAYEYVVGCYNSPQGLVPADQQNRFVVGSGSTDALRANAMRVTAAGNIYATNSTISTGADYAEYWEWEDGNPNNEDRRGYFVTPLEYPKMRIAKSNDYILGIISGQPSVIGNGDECWNGRYIRDEFGSYIKETFEYSEKVKDEETGEITTVITTGIRYKENPDYDPTITYIQRESRPEWDAVGMVGVLHVRDDGTCKVNGYCKVTDNGTATASDTGYRVTARVTENVIKVILQ